MGLSIVLYAGLASVLSIGITENMNSRIQSECYYHAWFCYFWLFRIWILSVAYRKYPKNYYHFFFVFQWFSRTFILLFWIHFLTWACMISNLRRISSKMRSHMNMFLKRKDMSLEISNQLPITNYLLQTMLG